MSLHGDMLVGDLWVSDPLFLLRDCPDYYSDTPSESITTGQWPLAVLRAHDVSGKIVEFFASSKRCKLVIIVGFVGLGILGTCIYRWRRLPPTLPSPPRRHVPVDPTVDDFVAASDGKYKYDEKLPELGSRMRKSWYVVEKTESDEQGQEKKLLTVAPVSQSCPLQLSEYQKGLNKLMEDIREHGHPYIHPIDEVAYMEHHQMLVIVQPLLDHGSLKDLIYKVATPTWKCEWSSKYAHCSKGLPPEDVARYGRQVLEGILFLYHIGFPVLGHVQSGNVFIVDDVCRLGGYENTLVGYKTRLFRLCKDYTSQLDVILFGHLIFEMSAGYELTQIRPSAKEYQTLPSDVRPVLEYIFEGGFPHSIQEIAAHEFFCKVDVIPFDINSVKLSRESKETLEKVRKNKPRTQKSAGEGRMKSFVRSVRQITRLPLSLYHRSRSAWRREE